MVDAQKLGKGAGLGIGPLCRHDRVSEPVVVSVEQFGEKRSPPRDRVKTMWFSHIRVGVPKQRSIKQLGARLTHGFRDSRKGFWLPNPEAVMVALGGF